MSASFWIFSPFFQWYIYSTDRNIASIAHESDNLPSGNILTAPNRQDR